MRKQRLTYRLKNLLLSLLLCAGFGAYTDNLYADHILGGEVSYKHVSSNVYKFKVQLYRNCNECVFNSGNCADIKNLEIYASPEELGFAKKLKNIPLTRISKRDITPVCKTVNSSCNGGSFPDGVEEWTFEGSVDFDTVSKDYCKFEIAIRVESRRDAWSQGGNEAFYNYARINTCGGRTNSSPSLRAMPVYLIHENQSFTYNLTALDTDGDSLSYHMVKAQKGWGQNIIYPTGRDASTPVDVYCPGGNCTLNEKSWPIEGTGIDEESGWLAFTPTASGQHGFLVLEVREWRLVNGLRVMVGMSRRDMQLKVISIPNNVPKLSSPNFHYYACEGKDLLIDLSVNDAVYGGIKDSVKLSFWSDIPGGSIVKIPGSKNQFDAFFQARIPKGMDKSKLYYISVLAQDDKCPLTASAIRTFAIEIVDLPKVTPKVSYSHCNVVSLKSGITGSQYMQSWFISDANGLLESRFSGQDEVEVPKPGKYYITYQIQNTITGCLDEYQDSAIVPAFSLLTNTSNWPDKVCSNQEFTLKSQFDGGFTPFKYAWSQGGTNNTIALTLQKDSAISVNIVDSIGCRLKVSKTIGVYERLQFDAIDTALCVPVKPYAVDLKKRIEKQGWTEPGNYSFKRLKDSSIISSPFLIWPNSSGTESYAVRYLDKHSCLYTDEFEVQVVEPLPTGIMNPNPICSKDQKLDLDKATQCVFTDGVWSSFPSALLLSQRYFDPQISGSGTFEVYYNKNLNGCLIRDTALIVVNETPTVTIVNPKKQRFCEGDASLKLSASPEGGIWLTKNEGVLNPTAVIASGSQSELFIYKYSNKVSGCFAQDTTVILVNASPKFTMPTLTEVCEGERFYLEPKPAYLNKIELIAPGDFSIQRLPESFIAKSAAIQKKQMLQFAYKITSLEGCADTIATFSIAVNPKPVYEIVPQPSAGCIPFTGVVKAVNMKPDVVSDKFIWQLDGIEKLGADEEIFFVKNPGVIQLHLITTAAGCAGDIATSQLEGIETPSTDILTDPENRTVTSDYSRLNVSSKSTSLRPYTLNWQFEMGSPLYSTKPQVTVDFPSDTGLYEVRLTITNDRGCATTDALNIRVRPGLQFYVPTVFTPDGKGPQANEVFKVVMDSTASYQLTVRNKWGEFVFKSNNPEECWNGRFMGQAAPAGVYIWDVEATTIYGNYVRKSGSVMLLR